MHVIELVIDGYKSYAVRTVISGWDPAFNAITGFNGSGKSNILDAICFVLGLKNFATVRAKDMQDLIYKRGQAGVTKASVTITFDNTDKSKSPSSLPDYLRSEDKISVMRQISLGGTSKYMINGRRVAKPDTVHAMFESVGLNINNPNFLIMQGKITKVLSMKPAETLGMLEEAAGTRMFEDRRLKAEKILEKKEIKVKELETLLQEEINPKLVSLREQVQKYQAFQNAQHDLERLTRLLVAYDHYHYTREQQRVADELEKMKQEKEELETSAVRLNEEIQDLEEQKAAVEAKRESESRKEGRYQALEKEVASLRNDRDQLKAQMDSKKSSITEEADSIKQLEAEVSSLEAQLVEKRSKYEAIQEKNREAHENLAKQKKEVEKLEELLQSLKTGVASREGEGIGYQDQLQKARDRAKQAASLQKQKKLEIEDLERRIKEEEPKAKKAKADNSGLLKNIQALKSDADRLRAKLDNLMFDPDQENRWRQQEKTLRTEIRSLQSQADELRRKVANVNFSYTDPIPNFDRSRVKGAVAELVTLDKENFPAGTALEVCAGGRLYNVVIDSNSTGALLLDEKRCKLSKRVTFIPLDKIQAFTASPQAIQAAERLSRGRAKLALALIGYDEEVEAAMKYVFGSTFICQDTETAKLVTFDRSAGVLMKSVTLDGDVYDPAGTLSGGSAPRTSGMLLTLQRLHELNAELVAKQRALAELQELIQREQKNIEMGKNLQQELELKLNEINLAEEHLNSNSSSSIIQNVENMRKSVADLKEGIKEAVNDEKAAEADVKRIERDMKELNSNRGKKLGELEANLDKLKKARKDTEAMVKPLQVDEREAMVDLDECKDRLDNDKKKLQDLAVSIEAQKQELEQLQVEYQAAEKSLERSQAELFQQQAKLTRFNDEIKAIEGEIKARKASIAEGTLAEKRLGHEFEKVKNDRQSMQQKIRALENEHDWVVSEQARFGRPDTPYDFNQVNIKAERESRKRQQQVFDTLKNNVNPRVMAMFDDVDRRGKSVEAKLKHVKNDKKKIEQTVAKILKHKKETMQTAWEQVNRDFGLIFNDILPGSFAKLDPPEGKEIIDGLEIKVMLGKVWKQSLNELSGGQRSLAAIAFMMALLQYKPAPMYILDEVDAALDPSHTQNIGVLIQKRFKGSQFIVVSLKDGMFLNANRIFRTKFVDNSSRVERVK
ncbi:RecF/RecN/SMC N terminal domain-containing protein [Westerdykella ornata]|uniref:Structural maintenance of chromosomes protein n=1 Tax=Westerdykella ornata TaxID=318751 RepID=A0A6A6JPT9_WESOR|nr:RecF/RecN/SMC N terminal domain-containing protein [Westerdykella ornata]KAF2278631.1 RecF/RecN/SMC N terminal domain-containing protein [Westerdykella ornata]